MGYRETEFCEFCKKKKNKTKKPQHFFTFVVRMSYHNSIINYIWCDIQSRIETTTYGSIHINKENTILCYQESRNNVLNLKIITANYNIYKYKQ